MRALVMDYPTDKSTYAVDDQYMFGPALMVCPVYKYKDRERSVYFPTGLWYDFYTGKSRAGGVRERVEAPYERMPLFVRGGSIIPSGEVVQTTADVQQDLQLSVYTGADASFTLYEDNGVTYAYEQGLYSTIDFQYQEASKKLSIAPRKGAFPEMIPQRTITVTFITPDHPTGKTLTVTYKGEAIDITLPNA
jgi:alpha-D-xyloside xylohydrolase